MVLLICSKFRQLSNLWYFSATEGQALSTRQVFVSILKTEGPRGFFKGAVPVLARAFPANACCFMGYEAAMYGMKLMGI